MDIVGDVLFIVLVNIKQLVDIRSGRGLSFNSFIIYLPKELIIPTLRLKKRLTNA